ncbi:glycosyltransferase family 2 protein [Caulobacter sp. 17J80-11]|nr:glycosyltransferase family 2 protein [Caulobacter sp. 17J80-11]MBC6983612.1 glycosyltransferase family 2 protein [Caulobacter sp. 17J80-11]
MAASRRVTAPAVSVLIVAYESGPVLARCLSALKAQTFQDFEILIADNGSRDGAAQTAAAADPALRLLEFGENLGFAEANNRAAQAARGRWLALLNPDAFAEPDWLEALVAAAEAQPDVRCFTSLQVAEHDPAVLDGAGDAMTLAGVPYRAGYGRARPERVPAGEVFAACGAAMLVERALFLDVGGFDKAFFCYCEDMDLGYRLRLRGERVRLVPDAVVRHVGSSTLGARSDFALWHGVRNRLWTYVKNTPPLLLAVTFPLHAAAVAALVAGSVLKGERAAWRGLKAGLAGLPAAWRARKAVQAARLVGSLEIARALTWSPLKAAARAVDVRA